MENLVGRKVKCVKRYRNLTEKKEYEIKSINERTFEITEDDGINDTWNIEWIKGYDEDGEYHFELLPNEYKFKQGDKVLVSNDGIKYREREFISITSEGKYLCWYEDKTNALPFIHIKPYEEEIKIGDWVHNRNGCIMKCDDVDIFNINNWTKITDEVLINKLNEL